jgi:tRNA(Arg) A34 adenosine deaminase TadA
VIEQRRRKDAITVVKCDACNGTGFAPVKQPSQPIYPALQEVRRERADHKSTVRIERGPACLGGRASERQRMSGSTGPLSRHAEMVAMSAAQQRLRTRALHDCTLYSTVEPCAMCSYAIRESRIGRVIFGLHSPVMGGHSRWNILMDETLSSGKCSHRHLTCSQAAFPGGTKAVSLAASVRLARD